MHSDLAAVRFASRLWAVAPWVDWFGCDGVRRVRGGGGGRGAGGVGGRGAGVFGARAREGAGGWVRADVEEGQELPPAQAARTRQVLMNFCVDYSPKKPLCRFIELHLFLGTERKFRWECADCPSWRYLGRGLRCRAFGAKRLFVCLCQLDGAVNPVQGLHRI